MPPHIVRYPPIQCNTRERYDQLQIPAVPPAWRVPEGPDSLAAVPMGGGRAWPGFEGKLHHTQRHKRRQCGGRRRVRRARAGFEIDHSEPQARVRRSRGRPDPTAPATPTAPQATRTGRPPPTSTHSGRTRRRPQHQRHHKHPATTQRKRAAARQGRRASTQLVHVLDTVERPSIQRSRAATTSATWTALRAAPLRRLSPETTRMRPRLPSTA